ncbi:MAG: AraC family transcriptional regulator, partial [Sphingomonas sp.]
FWNSVADATIRHLATRHLSTAAAMPCGSLDRPKLRALARYIEDNLAAKLDLADMAVFVGCDPFHFAHRFSSAVGVSPHRYVVRRRLERARALLQRSRHPVADIAIATGFSDQSHMTNWMRRICGVTPARYRKFVQDRT